MRWVTWLTYISPSPPQVQKPCADPQPYTHIRTYVHKLQYLAHSLPCVGTYIIDSLHMSLLLCSCPRLVHTHLLTRNTQSTHTKNVVRMYVGTWIHGLIFNSANALQVYIYTYHWSGQVYNNTLIPLHDAVVWVGEFSWCRCAGS